MCSVEIMFATRFHGIILSILFKQKIFPIIYSKKISNVLFDLNYTGSCLKIEDLNDVNIDYILSSIPKNIINIENLKKLNKNQLEQLAKEIRL